MYGHNSSVFKNLCLRTPKNPTSDHPLPTYEQKYLNHLKNEENKISLEINEMKNRMVDQKESFKNFIDFFDSIPEYDEINHLSNKEFYKKLENLKEKQKTYYELINDDLKFDNKDAEWISDYKKLNIGSKKSLSGFKKKSSIEPFCTTPILSKNLSRNRNLDYVDFTGCYDNQETTIWDKEMVVKPPSRRSVRIETPISSETPESGFRTKSKCGKKNIWDDLTLEELKLDLEEDLPPLETKSAPTSPRKKDLWGESGITIPKPFQMTVRDEENKIIEDVMLKVNKPQNKNEKHDLFKAHDIPIESQIPLFDKIMEDQERKNYIVREKRKAALQAQMRPFSFTRRDEELQALTRRFSKSTPSLYLDDPPIKIKKFKAKPVPKNLFSNYIYKKMHEDEFYRALQKKIRAEEMLKAASLPPSMSKREKRRSKMDVCPRSYRDLENQSKGTTKTKKKAKPSNFKLSHDQFEKQLEELKNDFISTSPRPFKLSTSKRADKKGRRYRNCSASSKSSDTRTCSSADLQSVNRSNLAAVLRIQSARQRLEMEMCQKLEEAKLKEEARWKEKLMRKKPVWQALAYSHEEDLQIRLQLRREEEKLRKEEHHLRMQLMLGRVHQQPTLFERQSQVKYPITKEDLINELYKGYNVKRSPRRCLSDLSDIRSMVEVKDEAIQTFGGENTESDVSKESRPEEKEKCDCFDD
ncbi:unnamed protein product [Brassicogethes aeneus]|uniref:Protein FAM161A n=1 Tax=Brassicogethes aeneus TaxID=1431903 RepID=A0A9P0AXZ1_BRAAE|nr:unnamed protein product [Brassicogethes aeneus]